ncbi:hypothetical protein BTVI_59762 [Pitangus sulphuratus]|nr:hypothetical protein BTVI_59762 [Pitangus sulphuratus]
MVVAVWSRFWPSSGYHKWYRKSQDPKIIYTQVQVGTLKKMVMGLEGGHSLPPHSGDKMTTRQEEKAPLPVLGTGKMVASMPRSNHHVAAILQRLGDLTAVPP